jgi:AcrR family transcriptional regulator
MKKPMTHAERNAETRRRLLVSARRIFLRKGFHATSLADVAKDAGYTKGAVFSQFESKADLFLALLGQRSSERLAQLSTLRRAPQSAASLVKAFTADWHENVAGDRAWTLLVIEFRVYAARNPSANRGYAAIHARTCARMAEIYKAIVSDAGLEVVLDLDTLARAVLGLSAGLVLEQSAKPTLDVATIVEAIGRGMFGTQRSILR